MPLVHTVFRETPFEMPDAEAEVLRAQGLLRSAPVPTDLAETAGTPGFPDGGTPDGEALPDPPVKKEKPTR